MSTDEQDLDQRLQQALQREEIIPANKPSSEDADLSGLAYGMRLGVEFLGGTLVGLGIGVLLDKLFDTAPWFILIFTFLGFGAGMLNVYRFIMQMDDSIGLKRAKNPGDTLTNPMQTGKPDAGENPSV